ncbi:MAG: hypothetical protein HFK09_05360 [Clostridia bacterium]|nr:hypothetical protein [Clostridia bacterium]
MSFLKKYGAKIFFGLSCVLLAAAIAFSAMSFARYVSHVGSGGGASTATIDCKVNVSGGGENTFVNAPFMQSVSGNTVPVRMNNWAETEFSLENHGKYGLKYEYGFVFYVPNAFADKAMFQFLELGDGDAVVKASDMYKVSGAELEATTQTSDGLKFENEYDMLINDGGKLEVDSTKVTDAGARDAKLRTTFVTTYPQDMEGGLAGKLVCPVSFARAALLGYRCITVNLARTAEAEEHILKEGDVHRFVLRTVLLEARDDIASEENKNFDLAVYGELEPIIAVESGYHVKWEGEGDERHLVAAEMKPVENGETVEPDKKIIIDGKEYKITGTYERVTPSACMGLGAPCVIAAVFTQVA